MFYVSKKHWTFRNFDHLLFWATLLYRYAIDTICMYRSEELCNYAKVELNLNTKLKVRGMEGKPNVSSLIYSYGQINVPRESKKFKTVLNAF